MKTVDLRTAQTFIHDNRPDAFTGYRIDQDTNTITKTQPEDQDIHGFEIPHTWDDGTNPSSAANRKYLFDNYPDLEDRGKNHNLIYWFARTTLNHIDIKAVEDMLDFHTTINIDGIVDYDTYHTIHRDMVEKFWTLHVQPLILNELNQLNVDYRLSVSETIDIAEFLELDFDILDEPGNVYISRDDFNYLIDYLHQLSTKGD